MKRPCCCTCAYWSEVHGDPECHHSANRWTNPNGVRRNLATQYYDFCQYHPEAWLLVWQTRIASVTTWVKKVLS